MQFFRALAVVSGAVVALSACSGGMPAVIRSAETSPVAPKHRHALPPAIATAVSYTQTSLAPNVTTTMTVFFDNGQYPGTLTNMAFSLTLPGGQFVVSSTSGISNTCGGTLTALLGTHGVTLNNGTLAQGADCWITVPISSPTTGSYQLAMPAGSVTTAQSITNATPSPNPIVNVNPPASMPTSHLYVPVPTRNTVAVYGPQSSGTGPSYIFSDTSLQDPTIAAANPFGGNVFVYSATTQSIAEFKQSNGVLVPGPIATTNPGFSVSGMTVDYYGRLVVVTTQSGQAGAYWFNTALQKAGKILSPSGQSWQTITSGGTNIFMGDENGHQIVMYATPGAPPQNNVTPTCSWPIKSVVQNPYSTTTAYDSFYIAFAGSSLSLATARRPHAIANDPLVDVGTAHARHVQTSATTQATYEYGELATTEGCSGAVLGSEQGEPVNASAPGGNDLTQLWGLAIDPVGKTAATSTLPDYNLSQNQLSRHASVPVWPLPGASTLVNNAQTFVDVGSGIAAGYNLGQPSYGP